MLKLQFSITGCNQKGIEGSVNIGNPSRLEAHGIMTEICGAKAEYAVMSDSKEGSASPGNRMEDSGLFDTLQRFESSPDRHDDGGMLLPMSADLLEAGIRQGDAGHAQPRRRDQKLVETAVAQIAIPFIEDNAPAGWNLFLIEDMAHMFRRLIVAASRCVAGTAGSIRRILRGRRDCPIQRADRR